jgi:ribulose-phosphate 3-epimerase
MEIIPTTNPNTDFSQVELRLAQIKDSSSWIQIDVTDGVLVKPPTFNLELLSRTDLNLINNLFDIHLMVKEPINWLNKCYFIDASRIIGQVEMMGDRNAFITAIKDHGQEAGLAFDVSTPLDSNIPEETDLILLMGRVMGFKPQPLDIKIFDRIKFFKDKGYKVAIDGGVTPDNFEEIKNSGVDIIYLGQHFLNIIDEKTT